MMIKKWVLFWIVVLLSVVCFGDIKKPEQDTSFFFGTPLGFERFGSEDVNLDWLTKPGLAYSSKGGFIDTTHLGECCLWTRYYQDKLYKELLDNERTIEIKSEKPRLVFHIFVEYPETYTEDQLRQISIELASYLAYNWAVVHEAMSWYGYKSTGVFSEFGSAFSPEDLYSDLLGAIISAEALKSDEDFEVACLRIMKEKLKELGLQNSSVVETALEKVDGDWYTGSWPKNDVWKRNFDIGEDGFVTPCLVEGMADKEVAPISLPVPKIPTLAGFKINVEIEPSKKQGVILLVSVGKFKGDFLSVDDFPRMMKRIKQDAEVKLKK